MRRSIELIVLVSFLGCIALTCRPGNDDDRSYHAHASSKYVRLKAAGSLLGNFAKIRNRFAPHPLPFVIDSAFLDAEHESQASTLDSTLVLAFLHRDTASPLIDTLTFLSSRFYPISRFEFGDSLTILMFEEICGAGGRCEQYYLNTFDRQNRFVQSLEVGEYSADCGFSTRRFSRIDRDGAITLRILSEEGDCTEEKIFRRDSRRVSLRINSDGRILRDQK